MVIKTRRNGRSADPPKPTAICQCPGCNMQPDGQTAAFCKQHLTGQLSPLSASEPDYAPLVYNKDPAKQRSHNCMSYAFAVLDNILVEKCRANKANASMCRSGFHQPGALSGKRYELNVAERRTCENVINLMMQDIPGIYKTTYAAQCPPGKSKIALVIHKGEDYHFYRQDSNGYWSHKDGSNKVKNFDSLKRLIGNPEKCCRDYRWQGSDLNYSDFCGFFCVPRNHEIVLGSGGGAAQAVTGGGRFYQDAGVGLSWRDHRRRQRHQTAGRRRPKAGRQTRRRQTRRH